MNNFLAFIDGKKTYTVCALLVIFAFYGMVTGKITVSEGVQLLGLAGVGSGLRDAVSN